MTTRNILEWESRAEAGSIERVGDYHWIKVLNKFHMYVLDSDQSVTPCLIRDGFWESWITAWLTNNLFRGSIFIDIGANTGYYSFLASYLGSTVLAFEPNPDYVALMNSTIMRTHTKSVFVQPLALSDYSGEAILNVPGDLHGSASLTEIAGYETQSLPVTVRPFDEVYDNLDPNKEYMVKIDAESEEERILWGMRRFIETCRKTTILLEYTPGAYSEKFLDELFSKWDVSLIEHDASDRPVSQDQIKSYTDWSMLVLRPKA